MKTSFIKDILNSQPILIKFAPKKYTLIRMRTYYNSIDTHSNYNDVKCVNCVFHHN